MFFFSILEDILAIMLAERVSVFAIMMNFEAEISSYDEFCSCPPSNHFSLVCVTQLPTTSARSYLTSYDTQALVPDDSELYTLW